MKISPFFIAFLAFTHHKTRSQVVFPDDPVTTKVTTTTSTSTTSTIKPSTTFTTSTTVTTKTVSITSSSSPSTTISQTTKTVPQSVSICVPVDECSKANLINDGSGNIVPRMAVGGAKLNTTVGTFENITTPASSGISLVISSQTNCSLPNITELCVASSGYQCGVQFDPVRKAPARNNTSPFGAYPWEGLVMRNDDEDKYTFYATGALIDHKHLLTVASKLVRFANNASRLRVRLGEWNLASSQEIIPYQEFLVSDVFIHPGYSNATMANNIALLRLAQNVPLGAVPTIGTVCLPSDDLTGSNIRCMVAGFGRTSRTGDANFIIRETDQPLLNSSFCQSALRNSSLGKNYTLDTGSWLCAGGELQKSNCDGDEGNPLVCNVTGQFYVVGLFSWAPTEQNCGARAIPQVYVNVIKYISWIKSVTSGALSSSNKNA